MVIFLSIIKGSFFSFMQYTHGWVQVYSSENINLNPIFSLLFFESRFLIYHHIPNFVVLVENIHLEGTACLRILI